MSDFNYDSRGKRADSLGSLNSETLTTDGGEHGWRKGPPSRSYKPSALDISTEELPPLDHDDGDALLQHEALQSDLASNHKNKEVEFRTKYPYRGGSDYDQPLMANELATPISYSQPTASFQDVANQNLKDHFSSLQGVEPAHGKDNFHEIANQNLKNHFSSLQGTDSRRGSIARSSSSDDGDIIYEADAQDDDDDESRTRSSHKHELFIPVLGKTMRPSISVSSDHSEVLSPSSWKGNISGREIQVEEDSSDGESIEYETDHQTEASQSNTSTRDLHVLTKQASLTTKDLMAQPAKSSGASLYTERKREPLLIGPEAQTESRNFAMEHRIFVKALLSLLAQRDMVAVDMDDPNPLKCGPLKKATSLVKGAWKFKYVEIRRGMFSYYDDSLSKDAASEGDLVRKNIKLNANTCTCRAVKLNHKSLTVLPSQAIFEFTVEGSPRRFWMANSRQERTAWIRAISDAMVGGTITRGGEQQMDHTGRVGKVSRKSPYKRDLATYLKVQREIKNANTKQAYVVALCSVVGRTMNVPVQWVSEQGEETDRAFRDDHVSTGVDQLWKDLARDTVEINGQIFRGGSGHAVERIIGALTCEIMRMDRSSPMRPANPEFRWIGVTELQALSFARDVLLSGNRTRSGGDSYYCVDALCQNQGMAVLVPSSMEAEPLSVTIGHFDQESAAKKASYSVHDRSGWVKTRTRHHSEWRRRYFVLSEGTLTFYRKAHPRPYAVEGQIKILETPAYVAAVPLGVAQPKSKDGQDAEKECFLLTLKGKEGLFERQLLFENKDKFLIWAYAIEAAISTPEPLESPKKNLKFFQMLTMRDEQNEAKEDSRIGFVLREFSLYLHAEKLGFEKETIIGRAKALALQHGGGTKSPTVNISVRASTLYKICTLDPQGDEKEDTWANVRATFLQNFTVAGGPNGLMNRSEEVVQICVLDCSNQGLHMSGGDLNLSPRMLAGSIGRKLRRNTSHDDVIPPQRAESF